MAEAGEMAAAARFATKQTTIVAGQSLSIWIDCTAGAPVFLHMPSDWTPAMLTFQVSYDNTNYNDLFGPDGKELAFNVVPGTSVRIDPIWSPVMYLKMRSGTRANPIPQEADRIIAVTVDTQN